VLGKFIIRMPQPVHCEFAEKFQALIMEKIKLLQKWLEEHNGPNELQHAVGQIDKGSTGDLTFAMDGKKSPDASFRYEGEKWPQCVIEVANSEKSSDLRKSAYSHMRRTSGNTKTVITIDLDYQDPNKTATLSSLPTRAAAYSLYRRKRTVHILGVTIAEWQKYFRLDDPTAPTPDGTLILHLSDFCPDKALNGHDRDILITHGELVDILLRAERHHNDSLQEEPPEINKPKWESDSPESEDEEDIAQQQARGRAIQKHKRHRGMLHP
jgi:hypothetical protein